MGQIKILSDFWYLKYEIYIELQKIYRYVTKQ